MEKLDYRTLVQRIIQSHSSEVDGMVQSDEVEEQLIFDVERDRYLLMVVGWWGERREYSSLIHVDIKGDKIWIQSDGTEVGIANELIEAGVLERDIVLGFKSPFKRQLMSEDRVLVTSDREAISESSV
jgi:XisI protein